MGREDIIKDRADAKADEDASQKEFDDYKKDSEARTKELEADKRAQEKDMGDAETKKGEINAVLKKIKDIDPNCEYYEVNYPMRRKNREIEIDGLEKAKAILKGGKFDAGPDPNREIKPGDAFLQKQN